MRNFTVLLVALLVACSHPQERSTPSRASQPQGEEGKARPAAQKERKGAEDHGPPVPLTEKALYTALANGRYEAAERACTRVEQSGDPRIWYYCGTASLKLNRMKEAEARYRKALSLGADFPDVYLSLSHVLLTTGRASEASSLLDDAIRKFPKEPRLWYNKGSAAKMMGDREAALSHYSQALLLDPDYGAALLARGELLYLLGRTTQAREDFTRLSKMKGYEDVALDHLAFMELKQGNPEKAWELIRKMRNLTARAYRVGGLALVKLGRVDEALAFLDKGHSRYPDDLRITLQYARLLVPKDPSRALKLLKGRKEPAARLIACQAMYAAGDVAKAKQCFSSLAQDARGTAVGSAARRALEVLEKGGAR